MAPLLAASPNIFNAITDFFNVTNRLIIDMQHFSKIGGSCLTDSDINVPTGNLENKKILYDLGIDQRGYKWSGVKTLNKVSLSEMPDYLSSNYEKYANWLE